MKTGGRIAIAVTAADQLGPIVAVASYMKVGRTWLFALKKCANRIHEATNPTPFRGGKTCKQWIMEWLARNPEFSAASEYPTPPRPSQRRRRKPSGRAL